MKLVVNEIGKYLGLKFHKALQIMVRHFYFILSVLGSPWTVLNRKATGHDVHFNNSLGHCAETGRGGGGESRKRVISPGDRRCWLELVLAVELMRSGGIRAIF